MADFLFDDENDDYKKNSLIVSGSCATILAIMLKKIVSQIETLEASVNLTDWRWIQVSIREGFEAFGNGVKAIRAEISDLQFGRGVCGSEDDEGRERRDCSGEEKNESRRLGF
ncbi:hypothetical protein KSP40_PGU002474 [Platanthera guangdongensis]|uniref:Uncharacterized protein n=1 Tax=Platanthera guangdongensis TaxID=2320717 RepID=A0ABR2MKL1_9ASPA